MDDLPTDHFRAVPNLWPAVLSPLLIISRHHAVLNRLHSGLQEPSYKIVQLKSVNPLFFKGKKVSEKVLEHGDTIEIGVRGHAEYIVKLMYQAAK